MTPSIESYPTKFCSLCSTYKHIDEFYAYHESKRNRTRREAYCKSCCSRENKEWRQAKAERVLAAKIELDAFKYLLDDSSRPPHKICNEVSCLMAGWFQPPEFFDPSPISKDGLSLRCRRCNLARRRMKSDPERTRRYHRLWYEQNRDILNAQTKQWRKDNPDEVRQLYIRRRFRQYGVTPEWYDEQLAKQGGGCAICGSKDPKNQWNTFHVDHDHKCCSRDCHACDKCRRGLLCSVCNTRLAFLEKKDWLKQATAYLRQHSQLSLFGTPVHLQYPYKHKRPSQKAEPLIDPDRPESRISIDVAP